MQKQRKRGIFNRIAQGVIRFYQVTFSPDKSIFFSPWLRGRICKHEPHCSQYGYECFDRYNFFTASFRTMDRISRCTPGNAKTYDPSVYRVVFASGSPIGVPFLEELAKDPRYEVVGVLTMPDKPSGRGMRLKENSIAATAKNLSGINSLSDQEKDNFIKKPHSLRLDSKKYADDAKEVTERLQDLEPDFIYTIAYGHIIPQHILDIPKIAPINIHGSLLPLYRGASPLQQVFVDGLSETGVTLMKMEAGLDSGPMIAKQIFKLSFSDNVKDLIEKINSHTPRRSLDMLDEYVHGEIEEQIQDEDKVSFCGKIEKDDGLLKVGYHDTSRDNLEKIYNLYRGYYLWPKVFFYLETTSGELRVIIEELILDETLYTQHKENGLFVDEHYTLNSSVVSLKVKPEGKKAMDRESFKAGYL